MEATEQSDVLYGIEAIAAHLGMKRRQAKHRIANREVPTFKMGRSVCARRSTLTKWLDDQERR